MKPRVDDFGKVTVSLGGICPLACRHCYTMTSSFKHDPEMTIVEVVEDLRLVRDPFATICVSGDTDPFLDAAAGLLLIQTLASEFPHANIMFTTRQVPNNDVIAALIELGRNLSEAQRLFIPAVSLVSMKVPNFSERSKRIPDTNDRIQLLNTFRTAGLPTLLALRPTFPLNIVAPADVETMIHTAKESAVAVLGEVFLLDPSGQLAKRLGLPSTSDHRQGHMTFMEQPNIWVKGTFRQAVEFARHTAAGQGLPYFLRSGSALNLLEEYWDFSNGKMRSGYSLDTGCAIEPDP